MSTATNAIFFVLFMNALIANVISIGCTTVTSYAGSKRFAFQK